MKVSKLINKFKKDFNELVAEYAMNVQRAQNTLTSKAMREVNKYDSYIDYENREDYFFDKYGNGHKLRDGFHYNETIVESIDELGATIDIVKSWIETDDEIIEEKFSVLISFK